MEARQQERASPSPQGSLELGGPGSRLLLAAVFFPDGWKAIQVFGLSPLVC